jgi:hypothetical protein
MGRRPRLSRRGGLAALALVPLAGAIAAAVLLLSGGDESERAAAGGSGGGVREALPLHPVAGTFAPDETALVDCGDGDQLCYEQAFGNIAYYDGPKASLDLFDAAIADGGPVEKGCHRIAHAIGSASLARNDGNVARTFAEGRASCWSGYYHGVLERALVDVKDYSVASLGAVARDLCDDAEVREIRWLLYQCIHGLGHGLMIATGYDLPRSLDTCERLSSNWDRTSCKGGVFMENISTSYGVRSKWVKGAEDPVYPCQVVEEDDKLYCYLMVTSHVLRVLDWDWGRTAEICSQVEVGWVDTCFQSFGRDASGSTRQSPERILELCAVAAPYGGEDNCISAAAKDMTANYARGTEAAGLCEQAPAEHRGGCYYAIGSIMGSFRATDAEREADCRALTKDERLVTQCLRGAGVAVSTA